MVALSKVGEVGDFIDADQFQPAKSQFECGFFAVALCKAMAQVGKPPAQALAQVIAEAEAWYAQYDGTDAISNTSGMGLTQLYDLLHQVGLHYQATDIHSDVVKKWLHVGYPVIIAILETSVYDMDPHVPNGDPYPWTRKGTHIIVVTGVAAGGNVLVRDTANCTDLYNPNSLRPGPRTYDAAKLALVSATVCVPPWMPRPASATPPTVAPAPTLAFTADDLAVWQLVKPTISATTGIAAEWLRARWQHSMNFGAPLEAEHEVTRGGVLYAEQEFTRARCSHPKGTSTFTWYDGRGSFSVPQ